MKVAMRDERPVLQSFSAKRENPSVPRALVRSAIKLPNRPQIRMIHTLPSMVVCRSATHWAIKSQPYMMMQPVMDPSSKNSNGRRVIRDPTMAISTGITDKAPNSIVSS